MSKGKQSCYKCGKKVAKHNSRTVFVKTGGSGWFTVPMAVTACHRCAPMLEKK